MRNYSSHNVPCPLGTHNLEYLARAIHRPVRSISALSQLDSYCILTVHLLPCGAHRIRRSSLCRRGGILLKMKNVHLSPIQPFAL
jgi:hypothetical protein